MESVHEVWQAIPDWEGFYEASDWGSIRSLPRTVNGSHGSTQKRPGVVRKLMWTGRYYQVRLSAEGRQSYPTVHSLVAGAFLGQRPPGAQINHVDGDRRNNRVSNLEYVTAGQNSIHAFRLGLATPRSGEAHGASVLSEGDVRRIRSNPANLSFRDLALTFGVSVPTIYDVLTRRSWKHI